MSLARYIIDRRGEYRLREPTRDAAITEFAVEEQKSVVRKRFDVEPIMKDCEFFRKLNEDSRGFSGLREMRHIGRLPFLTALHLQRAAMGDAELEARYVKRYLKDHPEFCTVDYRTI